MLSFRLRRRRTPLLAFCAFAVFVYTFSSLPYNFNLISSFQTGRDDPRPRLPLPNHTYTEDGLLQVNPEGAHPIFELMERAQKEWDQKLAGASRTLGEAVREYKRRYNRAPPKGFDDWWLWAEANNVLLPDEYDQIYYDLQPFWGIHPLRLQSLARNWEGTHDTTTFGKLTPNSKLTVLNVSNETPEKMYDYVGRTKNVIGLLEEVEWMLPAFRAIYSPHDNPDLVKDWEVVKDALEAAAQNKYTEFQPPRKPDSWLFACAPDSPAYNRTFEINSPASSRPHKSFIANHKMSMDPCLNPRNFVLHGNFLGYRPTPNPFLVPQFSQSPTRAHTDITVAIPYGIQEDLDVTQNPVWEDRTEERVFWRGRNTGMYGTGSNRWREAQRPRLVEFGARRAGNLSFLRPTSSSLEPVGEPVQKALGPLNIHSIDIAFSDLESCVAAQCEKFLADVERESNGTARPIATHFVGLEEQGNYKYTFDVDGHGWSGRFKRLMTNRALVFKMTIYPEWFQDRIQPWLHYVPIQMDLSDLHDAYAFFRGEILFSDETGQPLVDPNGKLVTRGAHDDLAKKIGEEGRRWSMRFWREEDMVSYMIRLLLEYGRVMSTDREGMSYDAENS